MMRFLEFKANNARSGKIVSLAHHQHATLSAAGPVAQRCLGQIVGNGLFEVGCSFQIPDLALGMRSSVGLIWGRQEFRGFQGRQRGSTLEPLHKLEPAASHETHPWMRLATMQLC